MRLFFAASPFRPHPIPKASASPFVCAKLAKGKTARYVPRTQNSAPFVIPIRISKKMNLQAKRVAGMARKQSTPFSRNPGTGIVPAPCCTPWSASWTPLTSTTCIREVVNFACSRGLESWGRGKLTSLSFVSTRGRSGPRGHPPILAQSARGTLQDEPGPSPAVQAAHDALR